MKDDGDEAVLVKRRSKVLDAILVKRRVCGGASAILVFEPISDGSATTRSSWLGGVVVEVVEEMLVVHLGVLGFFGTVQYCTVWMVPGIAMLFLLISVQFSSYLDPPL
jgi:hypothetical protein